MATVRTANAHWEGSLMEGSGQVSLESSNVGTFDVNWPARAEAPDEDGWWTTGDVGFLAPDGQLFLVMELANNGSLDSRIEKEGHLPELVEPPAKFARRFKFKFLHERVTPAEFVRVFAVNFVKLKTQILDSVQNRLRVRMRCDLNRIGVVRVENRARFKRRLKKNRVQI